MSRKYHNRTVFHGDAVGNIVVCDIKVRKHHGKRRLVALWRYPAGVYRMHESEVTIFNGYATFFAGSEHRLFSIPDRLLHKAERSIA